MTVSYCVVGGGISGLAAAHRLRATLGDAVEITVFDPADRLGGLLRTESLDGIAVEVGAEAFLARRPEVPALLAELGVVDRQRGTTGARPLLFSGERLHPVPPGTVIGIPSSPESMAGLVDSQNLARIADEPVRPLAFEPGSDPELGALVTQRFGPQVVSRSVDPLITGVYAGSAATVGLRSAVPGLAAALDAGAPNLTEAVRRALPAAVGTPVFGAIIGGYRVLVDALVDSAQLRWVRSAVTGIEPVDDGWLVCDEAGEYRRVDRVVVAAPAAVLARLVVDFAPRTAAAASRIETASSVVVAMAVAAGSGFPQRSGVLVATGESLHAKAITLTSRKWGDRGHGGSEMLRLSFGRFGEPPIDASDAELVARSMVDLERVFGVVVDPIETRVQRWPAAMPQYRPGHAGLVAELRAGLPPTMAVAGNYLDGVGVPACIAAADRAVAALISASSAP